jgi:hypothetical protein
VVSDLSGGVDLVRGMNGEIFGSLQAFSVRVHVGPPSPSNFDTTDLGQIHS